MDNCFKNCKNLTSVEFTGTTETIGISDFEKCTSLEIVKIPNVTKYIDNRAFYSCTELKEINIPNNLIEIHKNAFSYCKNLDIELIFPVGFSVIQDGAFYFCTKIYSIIFLSDLTTVGEDAFSNCINLSRVTYYGRVKPSHQGKPFENTFLLNHYYVFVTQAYYDYSDQNRFFCDVPTKLIGYRTPTNTFSKSHTFTASCSFTPTSQLSESIVFSNSLVFSQSLKFTESLPFENSIQFSESFKFTESFQFSKTSDFSESAKLTESLEFTKSMSFTDMPTSSIFTPFFSKSHQFSNSIVFSNSDCFTFSIPFTKSKIATNRFTMSNIFTDSNTFMPTPTQSLKDHKITVSASMIEYYITVKTVIFSNTYFQSFYEYECLDIYNSVSLCYTFTQICKYTPYLINSISQTVRFEYFHDEFKEKKPKISDEKLIGITCGSVAVAFLIVGTIILVYKKKYNYWIDEFDDIDENDTSDFSANNREITNEAEKETGFKFSETNNANLDNWL